MEKEYLGDSVYIAHDNYGLILTTENVPNDPSNIIYLEPEVVSRLINYHKRIFIGKEKTDG